MMALPGGDDTTFNIDLGATYSFNQIQLDTAIIENQFLNFYESWSTDFRILGVTINGNTYSITIDQHVTWQQLIQLINTHPTFTAALITIVDLPQAIDTGKRILQCVWRVNGINFNSTLVGGAWTKLGFDVDIVRYQHIGSRCYDLTQSPSIMVAFENIPNVMKTKYGQYSFIVPNNTTFGSRIFYHATDQNSSQRIILPYEVSVDRLQMRLLNCDLKNLETAAQNSQKSR